MSVSASDDRRDRELRIERVVRRTLAAYDGAGLPKGGGCPQSLFDRDRLRAQLQTFDEAALRAELPRGAGGTKRLRRGT